MNPDNYDLLRVWVLGRDFPDYQPEKWTTRLTRFFTRQPPPKPMEYYKRAVIAVRPKKQDKLLLKAFKEVPAGSLEQLFPDGKIQMSKFDNNIILASAGMASFGILAKIVTSLAKVDMQWSLVFTIVSGLVGFRWWTVYKNRHNEYLLQLSRMLYFKNIANNRGLLTLLVDRAEDELFKESLLSYMFLLTNRPPSTKEKDSEDQLPEELGKTYFLLKFRLNLKVNNKYTTRDIPYVKRGALSKLCFKIFLPLVSRTQSLYTGCP